MDSIIPDAELDCVGVYCPIPLFQTIEEIEKMDKGSILKVEADDPSALKDIAGWVKRTGHRIIKFKKDGNLLTFFIKKGG
ncbi:MAG: sulfurtransferase TusA family protein [Candidatus Firestonebacteria bacterium]|nr:sulfurtransferase TusA family protein [Candidatus Firestonebacteria bacterium]